MRFRGLPVKTKLQFAVPNVLFMINKFKIICQKSKVKISLKKNLDAVKAGIWQNG
jgi:hypothetical protein